MAADAATSGTSLVSVGNSALLVRGNSEYLSWSPASDGNRRTWTFSQWQYFGELMVTAQANDGRFLCAGTGSGNGGRMEIYFDDNQLVFFDNEATGFRIKLLPTYHSGTGWHHFVFVVDTPNAVSTDRMMVYHNGVRVPVDTGYAGNVYPAQDYQCVNYNTAANTFMLGADARGLSRYADGYIAESIFIDGLALEPTSFGEFDSTGLYWTPKSSDEIKALTFGTNGFYLDNTTNAQTDASGEGNNFTNNNTVTLSTNTPTNMLATFNPLINLASASTDVLSNGNNTVSSNSNSYFTNAQTTLAFTSGKYIYAITPDAAAVDKGNGPLLTEARGNYPNDGNSPNWDGFICSGPVGSSTPTINMYERNPSGGATSTTLKTSTTVATNDKLVMAVDADAGKVWMGWYDTSATSFEWLPATAGGSVGDPADGSNPTHTWTPTGNPLVFGWSAYGVSAGAVGTCTMDTDDLADFMTVPAGFKSLSTSGIAANTPTTAADVTKYFETILYEGNGAIQRVGQFQPFTDSFTIAKSALFNEANEEYFSRTFETPTDQDVWSLSWWMKTGFMSDQVRGIMGGATSNKDLIYVTSVAIYIAFNGVVDYQIAVADPQSFHHYYLTNNSGTLTFYIDGNSQGTASAPTQTDFNSAVAHTIGAYNGDANWFDGYMSDFVFVDGTVIALSAFGQTDTSSGRWVPKNPLTTLDEASDFGNNGFYLDFSNSGDMGEDDSGNNHDWTNNNTVTQTTDSPTTNFGTLARDGGYCTLSNGNRTNQGAAGGGYGHAVSGLSFTTEKIFVALLVDDGAAGAEVNTGMSIVPSSYIPDGNNGAQTGTFANVQTYGANVRVIPTLPGSAVVLTHSIAMADGDYFTAAIDGTNGNIWFGIYDTSAGTHQYLPAIVGGTAGNPALGTLPTISGRNFSSYEGIQIQTSGFGTGSKSTLCLASGDIPITLPTDYLTYKQDNLTSSDQFISAFSWIKNRDATDNHMLFDRVRGVTKDIHSNDMVDEATNVETLQSFLAGGAQVGSDVEVNTANESYVLWNWMMEATGSGASNTDGSINTTSTLVDTTLGMSVSTYVGTGANATIGHGLGVAPELVMIKCLNYGGSSQWVVYSSALGGTKCLFLDTTGAAATAIGYFNNTDPTSSVVSLGTSTYLNYSTKNHVAYCFAPSQFISIGSYEGNANADGAFVPTVNSLGVPIQPVWVLTKDIDATGPWIIADTARSPYNQQANQLQPDSSAAGVTAYVSDIVAGGFKLRTSNSYINGSSTFTYMAIGTPIIDTDGRIIAGR